MKLTVEVRLVLTRTRGEERVDPQRVLDDLLDNLIQSTEAADYDLGHGLWAVSVDAAHLLNYNG
jgi:hypothetical protein